MVAHSNCGLILVALLTTMYVPHLHAESALAVMFFNPCAMLCLACLAIRVRFCRLPPVLHIDTDMHNINTAIPVILSTQPSLQTKAPKAL